MKAKDIRTYSADTELVKEKRAEIVLQASKVFINHGYDSTSMRDLAKALGKSTGAFYHYIGSKRDILYLILDFTMTNEQEFVAKMREETRDLPPGEALKEAIRIYIESTEEFADMHIFVNHVMVNLGRTERKMMLDAAQRVEEFFEELLKKGVKAGDFEVIDVKMLAQNIVLVGNSWVTRRWFWKKYLNIEGYIRGQTDLIMKTITTSRGVETADGSNPALLPVIQR
jgi:AcrR family transcriptional regulator